MIGTFVAKNIKVCLHGHKTKWNKYMYSFIPKNLNTRIELIDNQQNKNQKHNTFPKKQKVKTASFCSTHWHLYTRGACPDQTPCTTWHDWRPNAVAMAAVSARVAVSWVPRKLPGLQNPALSLGWSLCCVQRESMECIRSNPNIGQRKWSIQFLHICILWIASKNLGELAWSRGNAAQGLGKTVRYVQMQDNFIEVMKEVIKRNREETEDFCQDRGLPSSFPSGAAASTLRWYSPQIHNCCHKIGHGHQPHNSRDLKTHQIS